MGWYAEHVTRKFDQENPKQKCPLCARQQLGFDIDEFMRIRNAVMALQMGVINWFQYLEICRGEK